METAFEDLDSEALEFQSLKFKEASRGSERTGKVFAFSASELNSFKYSEYDPIHYRMRLPSHLGNKNSMTF